MNSETLISFFFFPSLSVKNNNMITRLQLVPFASFLLCSFLGLRTPTPSSSPFFSKYSFLSLPIPAPSFLPLFPSLEVIPETFLSRSSHENPSNPPLSLPALDQFLPQACHVLLMSEPQPRVLTASWRGWARTRCGSTIPPPTTNRRWSD